MDRSVSSAPRIRGARRALIVFTALVAAGGAPRARDGGAPALDLESGCRRWLARCLRLQATLEDGLERDRAAMESALQAALAEVVECDRAAAAALPREVARRFLDRIRADLDGAAAGASALRILRDPSLGARVCDLCREIESGGSPDPAGAAAVAAVDWQVRALEFRARERPSAASAELDQVRGFAAELRRLRDQLDNFAGVDGVKPATQRIASVATSLLDRGLLFSSDEAVDAALRRAAGEERSGREEVLDDLLACDPDPGAAQKAADALFAFARERPLDREFDLVDLLRLSACLARRHHGLSSEQMRALHLVPLSVAAISADSVRMTGDPNPTNDPQPAVRDFSRLAAATDVTVHVRTADGRLRALPSARELALEHVPVARDLEYLVTIRDAGGRELRVIAIGGTVPALELFVPERLPAGYVGVFFGERSTLQLLRARPWSRVDLLRHCGRHAADKTLEENDAVWTVLQQLVVEGKDQLRRASERNETIEREIERAIRDGGPAILEPALAAALEQLARVVGSRLKLPASDVWSAARGWAAELQCEWEPAAGAIPVLREASAAEPGPASSHFLVDQISFESNPTSR